MSRLLRALGAVTLAAAGALVPTTNAAATGVVRLEAEHATLGPTCAGQAQYTYTNAAGDTLVFLGGDGCVVTSGTAVAAPLVDLRWHGQATATVCGVFVAKQLGTERSRTARTCSAAGAFTTATFGTSSLQPGPFELLWDPETASHDAHVDWLTVSGDEVRTEAENATPAPGSCYFETHSIHTLSTGETVVFHPGANCAVTYEATEPTWLLRMRWFGGGTTGLVCGTFAVYTGIYEAARTHRTCSLGGSTPDWQIATFPINVAPAGSTFHVRWDPDGHHGLDAHVDWVETTTGAPGAAAVAVSPSTLDFGLRSAQSVSAPQSLTYTSTDAAPFYVRSVAVGPRHFGVTSQSCSGRWFWQGQTCTVSIRHQPEWGGDHTATVYVDTSLGMRTLTVTGRADEYPPESEFDTQPGVTLIRGTHVVVGESDDELAGVDEARVVWRNALGQSTTVSATLTCAADRLDCTWTAPLPTVPGTYTATAQARDAVGHWESPGPSIHATIV